jgi:predicted porin
MKIKTTAIALAVAGTVAAPMAVQAEGSVYGSARIGVGYKDTADTADFDIHSHSSRFGAKGETDLGNGMTAYGVYEWDVDESDFGIRHRYAGLKGDFGNVYVGKTYHTFYNHTVGPVDPSYFFGGYAMVDYNGRRDDFITYASAAGAVDWAVSTRITSEAEEDAVDEIEVGVSFPIGDTTLGLGLHNTLGDADDATGFLIGNTSDEDVISVTWHGIALGDASLAVNFQSQDDDTSFVASLTMGGLWFIVEAEMIDEDSLGAGADTDPTNIVLGYQQELGRNTKMIYEAGVQDHDTGDSDDDVTQFDVIFRYDIK